jgi:hypothetical protein
MNFLFHFFTLLAVLISFTLSSNFFPKSLPYSNPFVDFCQNFYGASICGRTINNYHSSFYTKTFKKPFGIQSKEGRGSFPMCELLHPPLKVVSGVGKFSLAWKSHLESDLAPEPQVEISFTNYENVEICILAVSVLLINDEKIKDELSDLQVLRLVKKVISDRKTYRNHLGKPDFNAISVADLYVNGRPYHHRFTEISKLIRERGSIKRITVGQDCLLIWADDL